MPKEAPTPPITSTDEVARICRALGDEDTVMIDTEFIRDRSYWSRLCLVQLGGADSVHAIDPLAEGLDLSPLFELMRDQTTTKVFHAARQDLEIFHHLTGEVPSPLFDTQVAAMVCGFGDSVGYERLVSQLAGASIDKASQFTDWARRPLSERQLSYALADVTHLRVIHQKLAHRLEETGRSRWLDEEMAVLASPATYNTDAGDSWKRLKLRSRDKRYLGVLVAVATWREHEAQRRNAPRNHVLRDEAIQELAAERLTDVTRLKRMRAIPNGLSEGRIGRALIEAIQTGLDTSPNDLPELAPPAPPTRGLAPLVDLLKVLLKLKCDEHDVAQKLVATVAYLERIAADDDADVSALRGWRHELFGADALAIKHGRLALAAKDNNVQLIELDGPETAGRTRKKS